MDAIIISIGSELTTGQTVDTNTAWLSQRLAEVGVRVLRHVTVPDEVTPIRVAFERAASEAAFVLVTGGLGPTADDLTRDALAAAMGVGLELRAEYVERIRAFFDVRGREMPEANRVQAMFPAGSEPIENTCGTAPGIRARLGEATVFVMPGVPREMRVMYERDVQPVLASHTGGACMRAATLYCFGAGESDIGEVIRDLMARGRNPAVGTTAKQGVIGVRVHAWGDSRDDASARLEATVAELRGRLGSLIYGRDDDRIAAAAAELLKAAGRTVATAESCTGGMIAKELTDIAGSSAYFREGLVTYANEAKTRLLGIPTEVLARYGAVSTEVAEAMAVACRQFAGTDYALSVSGIAGPTGGTAHKPVGLVYIGLADTAGCRVTEHRFGEFLARDEIRERACRTALNRLRLRLLGAD